MSKFPRKGRPKAIAVDFVLLSSSPSTGSSLLPMHSQSQRTWFGALRLSHRLRQLWLAHVDALGVFLVKIFPMKVKTILILVITATTAFADTAADFSDLTKSRDAAAARAIQPIQQKFKEDAEKLLGRAIQAKDFETAEKIKREIAALEPASAESPFSGTYWVKGTNGKNFSVARFLPSGDFEELSYKQGDKRDLHKSKYTLSPAPTVSLRYQEGYKFVCRIDGDKMHRDEGSVWQKIDKEKYDAVVAAKSLQEALAVFGGNASSAVSNDTPFGKRRP